MSFMLFGARNETIPVLCLVTLFWIVPTVLIISELRFCCPIKWRKNKTWDSLLCYLGSHRCIPICGSKCCWECLRCNPESTTVKKYLNFVQQNEINLS